LASVRVPSTSTRSSAIAEKSTGIAFELLSQPSGARRSGCCACPFPSSSPVK
jgi:hypothetical protein